MDNGEALYSDKIAIDIGWDASSIRDLKAGDYFTFDLPASLKTTITSFSLPNEENVTVANAVITPKDGGGYTVKVTVTEDDDWAWEFTGLPKNKAKGEAIEYTVTEDVVADYETTYEGNDVINTYAPGKTGVTVVKNWDDSNNKDGIRPSKVTIKLLAGSAAGIVYTARRKRREDRWYTTSG